MTEINRFNDNVRHMMSLHEIMSALEDVSRSLYWLNQRRDSLLVANDATLDRMEKTRTDTLDDIDALTEALYYDMLRRRART